MSYPDLRSQLNHRISSKWTQKKYPPGSCQFFRLRSRFKHAYGLQIVSKEFLIVSYSISVHLGVWKWTLRYGRQQLSIYLFHRNRSDGFIVLTGLCKWTELGLLHRFPWLWFTSVLKALCCENILGDIYCVTEPLRTDSDRLTPDGSRRIFFCVHFDNPAAT